MASNLVAVASNLIAMASNHIVIGVCWKTSNLIEDIEDMMLALGLKLTVLECLGPLQDCYKDASGFLFVRAASR